MKYDPTGADEAARSVPKSKIREYESYWKAIRRHRTPEGVHQRWLYALASVNNSVAGHLLVYRWMLRFRVGFSAALTERQFVARLRRAKVGGQFEVRGSGAHRFDKLFSTYPFRWSPTAPTPADRDELAADVHGLGRAKTAFALELTDPMGCTAVCLDRHMLRLFGLGTIGTRDSSKVRDVDYRAAEEHWLGLARARNTSPFVLRSAFWDRRFGRDNCRWWSAFFEPSFNPYVWAAGFGTTRW